MTEIKICGITKLEEIEYMNELKPDYIGFVFSKSKRKINLEQSAILRQHLDRNIKRVGVFVNEDHNFVRNSIQAAKLQVVQLHGSENQKYINALEGIEVWKAIGVSDSKDIEKAKEFSVQGLVFDSRIKGASGGTGICFDWNIIKNFNRRSKIILAGGLRKDNIKTAIEIVGPEVLDVSSGVEFEGSKNFELCRDFIKEVRKYER